MAIRTKSELMNLITSGLANNTTGAITAEILRNLVIDIVDSCFNEPAPPGSVPPGTIIYVAMPNAPDGYLKANGQEVPRTTYANLFNAIGTRYGLGNGSTTFNVPDLRGTFIRCWSDGFTKDAGREFASEQKQGLCEHQHLIFTAAGVPIGHIGMPGGTSQTYIGNVCTLELYPNSPRAIAKQLIPEEHYDIGEVRPANIALLACIKY